MNAHAATGWRSVPRALLYPLKAEASLIILSCTLVIWLASTSLFGLPIAIAFAIGLVQFLLLSLKHSALGYAHPPRIGATEFRQLGPAPLKLLLVVAVWAGLIAEVGRFSSMAAMAMSAIGFLFLPAFTTLIALEESLHYALHPVRLVKFVLRGGLIYLLFASAIALLLQGSRADVDAARLIFGMPPLGLLPRLAAATYLATAATHVLGNIAFVAHDFSPPAGHSVDAGKLRDPESPQAVAGRLDMLLRNADRETVLQAWESYGERDHVFQTALLDALLQQRARALVPWQAQRAITQLLGANRSSEALRLAMHTLTTHASFSTAEVAEWLALCETAAQTGKSEWLATLAGHANISFPGHAALLDIALLRARHLVHQQDDAAQALQVLAPHATATEHPRHPELVQLQRTLQEIVRTA